jgi:hypothetical protein
VRFLGCLVAIISLFSVIRAQFNMGYEYPRRSNAYFDYVEAMYRKPTEKELKLVAVNTEFIEKYRTFLSKENTGIFRLIPDFGCNENRNIVVVKEECTKYSMPGSGSAFSFRKNGYRLWRLADLIYRENVLFSGSRYTQGILGALGDVDLEGLSLSSAGVKQLREFVPPSEYKVIEQQYKKIERGIIVGNVFFSNKMKVKEDSTYILRSIAYRGKSYTSVGTRVTYDEFEFDKRFDILIGFRVVKKDQDGSLLILWKELERKESPKLQFPKENEQAKGN